MKKLCMLSAVALAALFASCDEDENVTIAEKQTPPLAGCIYNYEDSAYVGELWFSPDEPIFVYTHTTPQGGGYATAGIQYELIFPYVFFDPTETPQIDIKKIKVANSLELEVTLKDGQVYKLRGGRGWNHDEMDNTYTDFVDE